MSHDSSTATILIRRSSTKGRPVEAGTGNSLLQVGELAYSSLVDTEDDGFGNGGDRLYIGSGNVLREEVNVGTADSATHYYSSEITTIGGKYFTDMLNHQRGVVTSGSALLVDDDKKLNELLVDSLRLDGDSVASTAGPLNLRGADGNVRIQSNLLVDGTLTVDGVATFKAGSSGSIQMGDSNTDNVVFGADVNSNLVPNLTDTYDLGDSVQRWRTVYAQTIEFDSATFSTLRYEGLTEDRVVIVGPGGILADDPNFTYDSVRLTVSALTKLDGGVTMTDSATIQGNLKVDGSTTLDTTLDVTGVATFSDNVVFNADINSNVVPDLDVTFDLGSESQRWKKLHVREASLDSADLTKLNVSGPLNVDGITTLDSTTIDGHLVTTGDLTIGRDLYYGGDLTINRNLTVNGTTTLDSVYIEGSLLVPGDINVSGLANLDSTTIDGDLTVTRNFTVLGDTTSINTTELVISDKRIVIADGAPSDVLASGAGIAVGDSSEPYGTITYKNDGVNPERWEFDPVIYTPEVQFDVIDCGDYFYGEATDTESSSGGSVAGSGSSGSSLVTNISSLTDVTLSNVQDGQVLKYSQGEWINANDLTGGVGGGIALTDISVSQLGAAGSGSLSYNNVSGVFTYTPPVLPSDQNIFSTVAVSGQSNITAGSTASTLNFAAGTNVSLTTDAGTNTVTINSSITETPQNVFTTVAVSGQTDIATTDPEDTLTFAFTGGLTATTSGKTLTIDASGVSGGGSSVAVSDEGSVLTTSVTSFDFTGAGVTASEVAGVVTVNVPGGGGSGLASRTTPSVTTNPTTVADQATTDLSITNGFPTYALLKIQTNVEAWVRIYTDTTSRTADASRLITDDPAPDAGVIAEAITSSGNLTIKMSPGVIGWLETGSAIPIAVTNLSGTASVLEVTLTVVELEV